MIDVIFENISVFPEWIRYAILTSWGIFLCLIPVAGIIKILQANSFKNAYHFLSYTCRNTGDFLKHQIDDPIKFPRIEKAFQYVVMIESYILSLWLFVYFIFLTALWALTDKALSIAQHVGILSFCLLCAYMSAVLKTQGNKELIRIRTSK